MMKLHSLNAALTLIFKGNYPNIYILVFFVLTGTAIYSPYIQNQFNYDDYLFISFIEEKIPVDPLRGFWAVDFKHVKIFQSMWWADKDAWGYFFRPVPTFVIYTAYNIWGRDSAMPLHLFSVLLHCLNAFLVFVFLNKLSKNFAVSALGGFLYLIFLHHNINIGWISTNTDLLAVFFMLLCLIFYILFRETGRILNLLISSIMLIIAFGCKETALVTPLAILLYEFIYAGKQNGETVTIAKRFKFFFGNWKNWIISFIILAAFLVYYKASGYGVNALMYYDPFLKPAAFLKNLVTGYPMMFLALTSPAPISFAVFIPQTMTYFWFAGILSMALLFFVLKPYYYNNAILFCLLLFIISIMPQLSADATERQMYFPAVAGCFILAWLVLQIPFLKEAAGLKSPVPVKYIGRLYSYYLFTTTVFVFVIMSVWQSASFGEYGRKPERYVLQAKEIADKNNAEKIFLLNAPGSLNLLYMTDIYRFHSGKFTDFTILYGADGKTWMKKINDSTISIKTDKKGWLTNMFAMLTRTEPAVVKGKVYQSENFRVVIKETTAENDDVLEAEFYFNRSLVNGGWLLLYFDGEKIRQLDLKSVFSHEWIFIGDTSDVLKNLS